MCKIVVFNQTYFNVNQLNREIVGNAEIVVGVNPYRYTFQVYKDRFIGNIHSADILKRISEKYMYLKEVEKYLGFKIDNLNFVDYVKEQLIALWDELSAYAVIDYHKNLTRIMNEPYNR